MSFVLDCSVAMAWGVSRRGDRGDGPVAGLPHRRPGLRPPPYGRSRSAACLLAATKRGRLRADEWPAVCASLHALPIEIDPVSASRVWGPALALADEHNLSVYDAMYLELALRMRLPLATLDRALAAAAQAVGLDAPGGA